MTESGSWAAIAAAVVGRPGLWRTAVRQLRRTTPSRWWRHRPFLPVPSRDYLGLRSITQYGELGRRPSVDDVVDYLEWCKRWDRWRR